MNPEDITPVELAALLGRLTPAHPLSVAARAGLEVAERRIVAMADDDYCGGRYHREHPLLGPGELALRWYPPTGDRDLWILYGPDGPPPERTTEVAA